MKHRTTSNLLRPESKMFVEQIPIFAITIVCAAIKEMEEVSIKELNWHTLKKWAATLNQAKGLDFEVGFANNLLQKNLCSYFCHSRNFGRN